MWRGYHLSKFSCHGFPSTLFKVLDRKNNSPTQNTGLSIPARALEWSVLHANVAQVSVTWLATGKSYRLYKYVYLLNIILCKNAVWTTRSHYGELGSIINYHYLLTPWCRVLLEKLTGLQPVKKFPAFHGTRWFITALTSVRQLSLSWASPIQSIYPHPTSWRSILILSTHLRLGLPSGLFPSGFPTKTLYASSPHPYAPHAQPI